MCKLMRENKTDTQWHIDECVLKWNQLKNLRQIKSNIGLDHR